MATVYLARDRQEHRDVALKVLRPELSGALGGGRFTREIAIAGRLRHPHILPIYDGGTLEQPDAPPVLFYTMPYVAGRSLRDRLDVESQLSVAEATAIARQVAEALDHAHRQGIIHRDIKPENILLRDGDALVADFGIARALDAAGGERLTETGLALGTPAYMSPEQGSGSVRLDGRADVYALGCVLYEMLTGSPPFTGPTAQAILARHAMDPMPSLRTVRPEVGLGLARVVRRALAKVPADRFPTAGALAQALADPEAFAASAGASAEWTSESVSATGAGTRRGWHARPVRAGVAALGLAALVVGLALALHARRPPPLAVDPARIAVAPFRVSAADPALGYLREGMVDLLATKLGGTQAVHPVDSRTLLAAWREGRRGAREPSGAEALTVAGRLGAGRLVEGELVASGRRLTLSATLRAVPDGRAVLRVSVEGSADSLTPLVEQVAARLLARAAEEPEERLPALAATSPAALRAYLDGEVLLRQHVIPTASVRKFDEALAADSSLVLAALGVVRAAARIGGDFGHPRVHAQVETAWRFRDRLSRDDRAFLEVLLGPRYPEPVTWRALLEQAGAYAQLAPDRADAWHFYGGILLQVGILTGIPDASRQAETALGRALALDSSDAASAAEFARLAAALGDTAAARRGIRLLRQSDSSSPGSVATQWLVAARLGDTATAHRIAHSDSLIATYADEWVENGVWPLLIAFLQEGLGLDDLVGVLQRSVAGAPTGAQRRNFWNHQYLLDLYRGRSDTTQRLRNWGDWPLARAVGHIVVGDDTTGVGSIAALESDIGRPIGGQCCFERFAAGEYALHRGRLALAGQAAADLERVRRPGPDGAFVSANARGFALILGTQLGADSLRSLDSMLADPPGFDEVTLFGNLIASGLHERRGETAAALAAVRRTSIDGSWPEYIAYHRIEGRLAAAAGDTAGAVRAYRRYLRIRGDAEPRLQPEVQRVRRELAALEAAASRR